jgi:hypothetical protein
VRIEVSSTSHQASDADAPDAVTATVVESDTDRSSPPPGEGELSKADRLRIENATTRYLLEETAGSADDWSTF